MFDAGLKRALCEMLRRERRGAGHEAPLMANRLLGTVVLASLLGAPALAQTPPQQPASALPSAAQPSPSASAPQPGATATPVVAPIRTLQYTMMLIVGQTRENRNSGIGTGDSASGGSRSIASGGFEAKGTISVDVITTMQDGGLLVDATENATGRMFPKVRVSVFNDGRLTYDPKQQSNLSEEELSLLRWLARGFYSVDRATDPGTTWNVDASNGGVRSSEHYRVVSNTDGKVNLDYKMESTASGANGYTMTRLGNVLYDTRLTVPVQVNYRGETRVDRQGGADTTTSAVALNLTADSFAHKS